MEQRTVIISAIILAFILTGILWYTLVHQDSQNSADVALESPTPTITSELRPTDMPAAIIDTPTPQPAIAGTKDVAASAKTGTTEWLIGALIASTVAGAWGLNRSRQLL